MGLIFALLCLYVIYKIGKVVYKNLSNIKNRIGSPAATAIGVALFLLSFFLFDQLNSILSIFFGMVMIGSIVFINVMIFSMISEHSKSSRKSEIETGSDEEYKALNAEYFADRKSRKERYYK